MTHFRTQADTHVSEPRTSKRRPGVALVSLRLSPAFKAQLAELERRFRATPHRTTRRELFELHHELCLQARVIARQKNRDYGTRDDALANYRRADPAGVTSAQAIYARLEDKLYRLGRAARGKLVLKDDDIADAINQLVHLAAALQEREGNDAS